MTRELASDPSPRPFLHAGTSRAMALAQRLAVRSGNGASRGTSAAETAAVLERIAADGLLAAPLRRASAEDSLLTAGEGLGVDANTGHALLTTLRFVGQADLAAGRIYEGHVNALQLIDTYGTPQQRAAWATDARRGFFFGVWNTEAAGGVTLEPHGDEIRLHGAKTFGSGAGRVERMLITGRMPNGGSQMCIVPLDALESRRIDRSTWQPLGMMSSDSFRVDFEGLTIAHAALLGAPDDYHREPWFNGGAIRFAAVQHGGAHALLTALIAYLRELGRTGDAFQQARTARAAIAVETGDLWLLGAARRYDAYLTERTCEAAETLINYARMTRTLIESTCNDVLRVVEQSVGARGMLEPHPFARLHRDLTMYLRQPAPDAVLTAIGRQTLTSFDERSRDVRNGFTPQHG